ncbi:amino acid transporter, partial [Tothia fuscella]
QRYISLKPIVSFGLTTQASWESVALTFQASLYNGGPVTLVYGIIIATLGSSVIAASLGEMASMFPTVGAQYRWTARHTPKRLNPVFWGLLQGRLCLSHSWVASCALTPFVLGTLVQGMVIFNNPDYVPERWHGTLIMWCFIILPVVCNLYARRILVVLEIMGGIFHLVFFICVMAVLVVMSRRSSNEFVWATSVNNITGWTNPGAAFSIGLLSPVFVVSGFDSVLHMSDEVKDAKRFVPRSMLLTVIINGVFAFGFIVALLYGIGDLDTVLASPTGLPIIEVFYLATKSKAATNVLMIMILIVSSIGNFGIFASVSRLTWAFARDRGLPFSDFFSYVHPTLKIPTRALGLISVLCAILALINIGSTTAFFAILSLSTLSLYISYMLPIFFVLLRKLEGRHPTYGPFSLGKWGVPINVLALVYGCYMIVFMSFPTLLPVTASTMNYAAPVWIACLLFALGDWFFGGHKRFKVPAGGEPDFEHEKSSAT